MLIKITNNNGPMTLPWGTPLATLFVDEVAKRFTVIDCMRSDKYAAFHTSRFPLNPYVFNMDKSFECDTVSNALAKPIYTTSMSNFAVAYRWIQLYVESRRFVLVERLGRNPFWDGAKRFSVCICWSIVPDITFSHILLPTHVEAYGSIISSNIPRTLFLKMGVML